MAILDMNSYSTWLCAFLFGEQGIRGATSLSFAEVQSVMCGFSAVATPILPLKP